MSRYEYEVYHISLIIKLLSEKRLQEKVDEENEVRKLRIEISKLKGENFRLSEGFEEKNAEIEKITDEKLEIQKKVLFIDVLQFWLSSKQVKGLNQI